MHDPAFMCMPLLTGNKREAVQFPFGIGKLNTITGAEIAWSRHGSILGVLEHPKASILME